jgi:hypothetical protein
MGRTKLNHVLFSARVSQEFKEELSRLHEAWKDRNDRLGGGKGLKRKETASDGVPADKSVAVFGGYSAKPVVGTVIMAAPQNYQETMNRLRDEVNKWKGMYENEHKEKNEVLKSNEELYSELNDFRIKDYDCEERVAAVMAQDESQKVRWAFNELAKFKAIMKATRNEFDQGG